MNRYELRGNIPDTDRKELEEYSDILANLLYHRGIRTKKAAYDFLNPNYDDLHDPFLFKDMDKAISKIIEGIKGNKRICIYTDYDADGIPGAVILSDFFKKIEFDNYFIYIPHRNIEGFGLNKKAIEYIKKENTDLVITIDCGIVDYEEVELVNSLGMEIIITDHHEPNDNIPNAYAIINHRQENCNYPEQILCGSGVIFKVVQALIKNGDFVINNGWEKWLLDMVGIATLSDMVPLQGENRILAYYGLLVLKKSKRKGLQKILSKARINQNYINGDDVVFSITPKINAASRMGVPMKAYEMLSTDKDEDVSILSNYLDEINNDRRVQVSTIVKNIKKDYSKKSDLKVITAGDVNWRPSILGLVANTIMEEYRVPVFLWGRGEGSSLKGSCRVPFGMSCIDIMNHLPENIFESYGGHQQAGGFVVCLQSVDLLQREFELIINNLYPNGLPEVRDYFDFILRPEDINNNLFNEINKCSPFGVFNEKPKFMIKDCILREIISFGSGSLHLKIVIDGGLEAISFFTKKDKWNIEKGQTISILGEIEESRFNGYPKVRIKILDIIL